MTRWNNHLKTVVLLGALSALLVGMGSVLAPGHLGLFALLAIGMNVGAYFFSDRLVLRMHGARALVNPFAGGRVSRFFATHPATEDRVARLEAMAGRRLDR